jgi:hypothetical protein
VRDVHCAQPRHTLNTNHIAVTSVSLAADEESLFVGLRDGKILIMTVFLKWKEKNKINKNKKLIIKGLK